MKKIIVSVLVAALVIGTVVWLGVDFNNKNASKAELAALSDRSLQLTVEKNKLLEKRSEIVTLRDAETKIGNYVVLFFDNVDENLIDSAYPLVEKNGHKGTIVLCENLVPGEEGNISRDDFDFLLEKGWDYAIGYNSDIDMKAEDAEERLAEYLDSYIARLNAVGIDTPLTYCFNQGEYKPKFEDILWERGFRIIRHNGETGSAFASAYNPDAFYYVGSGICSSTSTNLQENVDQAYKEDVAYSMSVRYISDKAIDTRRDCTTSKYQRMLTYLENYCPGVVVCPVTELYNYKVNQYNSASTVVGEYNAQIDAIDTDIKSIDQEVQDILEKLR